MCPATYQHGWTAEQLKDFYPGGIIFPDGRVYCPEPGCWCWPFPPSQIWQVTVTIGDQLYVRWATQAIFYEDYKLGFVTIPAQQQHGQELELFPQANEWPLGLLKPDPPTPYLLN